MSEFGKYQIDTVCFDVYHLRIVKVVGHMKGVWSSGGDWWCAATEVVLGRPYTDYNRYKMDNKEILAGYVPELHGRIVMGGAQMIVPVSDCYNFYHGCFIAICAARTTIGVWIDEGDPSVGVPGGMFYTSELYSGVDGYPEFDGYLPEGVSKDNNDVIYWLCNNLQSYDGYREKRDEMYANWRKRLEE